jgi:hypothetical protein
VPAERGVVIDDRRQPALHHLLHDLAAFFLRVREARSNLKPLGADETQENLQPRRRR